MNDSILATLNERIARLEHNLEALQAALLPNGIDPEYQDIIAKARENLQVHPPKCKKCRGTGQILGPSDAGHMDCTACDGKGH